MLLADAALELALDANALLLEELLAASDVRLEAALDRNSVLEQQALSTMDLATTFISADIKQPQGYDIYLATAMIYFRIGERNTNEYTRAEQIARQFFETQKATSGRAIHTARFYWAALTAAHAAWQWNNDRFALNAERKTDLLLCLAEGRQAELDDGARRIRLLQYLEVIEAIIAAID